MGRPPRRARLDRRAAAREGLLLDGRAPPHREGGRRGCCAADPPRPGRRTGCGSLWPRPRGLGLDTLVEAHDAAELARAIALEAPVVGVNARDLSTFAIDRAAQLELVATVPDDRIVIAESGIESRAQGAAAELAGADAILVGSTLMRAPDPAAKLRRAAVSPAGQGLRADARGGRRGRRRGRRRPARLRARAGEPAGCGARPPRPRDGPRRRRVGRRGRPERRRPRPGAHGGGREGARTRGDPLPARRAGRARSSTSPGARRIRRTGNAPRAAAKAEGRIVLAGGLGPENVADAIAAVRPVGGRRLLVAGGRRPASRTTPACGPTWRRHAVDCPRGDLRRVRRPVRPRDADPGARGADGRLERGEGRRRLSRRSWTSSAGRTSVARRRSRWSSGSRPAGGSTSSART